MLDDRIFKVLAGFVLALSLAACGGGGGGGGNGGGSVATGWIVAFRETPGSEAASVYRAGALPGGTPVVTVAGGRRIPVDISDLEQHFEPKELMDVGLTLYRVPESAHPSAPLGDGAIGLFRAGAPVTLAAPMTNHYYKYAGFQPGTPTGRILVRDAFSTDGGTTATAHSLLSFDVAGGGMRTLATNCTSDPAGNGALVASAEGVLFKCDGTANLAFSDGKSAAIMDMPNDGVPGAAPRPLAVLGGRAISFDGVKYVTTKLLDGSGSPVRLAPAGDSDTWPAAVSGTRMLILTFTAGIGYRTYSVSADGTNPEAVCTASSNIQLFQGPSPDGSKYLLAINDSVGKKRLCAGSFAYLGGYTIDLTPGFAAVAGWWYADGKVLVEPPAGSGAHYSTVNADGSGTPVDLGEDENAAEWAVFGDNAILQQQGPAYALKSIKEDDSSFATLTPNFMDAVSFQLVPSVGRLTFTDDALVPWIATPDGSFKMQLDANPAGLVRFTGNSGPSNGNRDYYVITRPSAPSTFDTVSFDPATRTVVKLLTGEYGVWVPN